MGSLGGLAALRRGGLLGGVEEEDGREEEARPRDREEEGRPRPAPDV